MINQVNSAVMEANRRRECFYQLSCKTQITKLAVFVLIVVAVASITLTGNVSYDEEYYFLQNKVLNKNTRGIFPPLSGQLRQLYGRWSILIQITQEKSSRENFKSYKLLFQKDGTLQVSKESQNCTSANNFRKYIWETFSFNIKISQNLSQPDQNNLNEQKNENAGETNSCFGENEEILRLIENMTVWTFTEENLFLMSEEVVQGKIRGSIFALKKQ